MEYNLTLSTENEYNIELDQSSIIVEKFMEWGSITGNIEDQADLMGKINSAIYDDTLIQQDIDNLEINKADKTELAAYALKTELPDGVDLSVYALKTEIPTIPDHSIYALKTEIPSIPNLEPYALKTEIPSTTGLATEEYVTTQISNIPSADLTGYATKTYVNTQISNIPDPDLSAYALKTEIPSQVDLTPYALKTELPTIPDHSIYALKTEIPSVVGLATETYVDTAISNLPAPYDDTSVLSRLSAIETELTGVAGQINNINNMI